MKIKSIIDKTVTSASYMGNQKWYQEIRDLYIVIPKKVVTLYNNYLSEGYICKPVKYNYKITKIQTHKTVEYFGICGRPHFRNSNDSCINSPELDKGFSCGFIIKFDLTCDMI